MTLPTVHAGEFGRAGHAGLQLEPDRWPSRDREGFANGTAVVQDGWMEALPPGWPPVRVLVLFPPTRPGTSPALARSAARRLVRQVLQQRIGSAAAAHCLGLPREARGAQSVSVSHEAEASLLAWCPTGTLGVDLVDLDSLALARQQDLVATAALYLGPEVAAAVAASPLASEARVRFALHWTRLEARLKCLGLQLEEWHHKLASLAGNAGAAQVRVLDCNGRVSERWIGCVAWRATAQTRA